MSKQLPSPPKFIRPTSGNGEEVFVGPKDTREWDQLYRWFFSMWRMVESMTPFPPPSPGFISGIGDDAASDALALGGPIVLRETPQGRDEIPPVSWPFLALPRVDIPPTPGVAPPYQSRRPLEILNLTQAQYAVLYPLLAGTVPVFIYVTDYAHMIFWDGSAAKFCGDAPTTIQGFFANPGTGYALCDGSNSDYLNIDGSVTAVTLPDLVSSSANAAYLKFGSPASLTPNAAIAPTLTMNSYTPAGTISSTFTGSSFTPAGSVSAPVFTGTAATITNNTFTPVALATTALTSLDGSTTSYTPQGTNSAPTFTGTPGTPAGSVSSTFSGTPATLTGTISATGEPRNLLLRPYFRR